MDIERLYLDAQASFVELVADLGPDDWTTPVPCNPGWTVHDVLSHVAGLADDVLEQRLDGIPGDAWTAAQIERWRDMPRQQLIDQWNVQAPTVANLFAQLEIREPVFDCNAHEHDVRHALDRPGKRDSEVIRIMVERIAANWEQRPIHFEFEDGETLVSSGDGQPRTLSTSRFDLARSRLGRRSRAQVAAWNWSEPLTESELDAWFAFGPTTIDIIE